MNSITIHSLSRQLKQSPTKTMLLWWQVFCSASSLRMFTSSLSDVTFIATVFSVFMSTAL